MAGRLVGAVIAAALIAAALIMAPSIAAGGLLYPARHALRAAIPPGCENRDFQGDDVTLRGWQCGSIGKRRGTIIFLHGVADNRGSSVGVVQRFTPRGFDVVAYDSRRHGQSPGEVCTYGFVEKRDLRRVIDGLSTGAVVLIGTSLGAAVALQEAASDPRVATVVAAESFSDLRTVATERAPWYLPGPVIRKAFIVAEQRGRFLVDAVSPLQAARTITAPVLLIHGAEDKETPPAHSQRIFEALTGPRRLMLVPGAGHNQSLYGPGVWGEIERWIEEALELRERRFAAP
jgi:pimeloyl-ACP methyl ester carboxylesterase